MRNSIYIQEIERLNPKISIYNLIDKYMKGKMIIAMLMFILPYLLFSICFYLNCYILGIISFIITIFLTYLSFRYMDKSRRVIVQKKYSYNLQKDENIYDKAIPEIQKQELKRLLGHNDFLTKENLPFIIESLKSKKEENKYGYTVTGNVIILFVSLLLVLLSRYLDFIQSIEVFENAAKIISAIGLLILVTVIYLEHTFKDWKLNRRKNKNRIIRTLENIYLDISN